MGAGLGVGRMIVQQQEPETAVAGSPGDGGGDVSRTAAVEEASQQSGAKVRRQVAVPRREMVPSAAGLAATASERFQRDAAEWQGMRNAPEDVWPCSSNNSCDRARACVEDMCVPCAKDDECSRGELCVLGACVLTRQVGCQSQEHCKIGELCVLSGYTPLDPRGNGDLVSWCLFPDGGEEPTRQEQEAQTIRERSHSRRPVTTNDLPRPVDRALDLLRENRKTRR